MERRQNRTLSSERRFPSSYHPGDADAVIHPRCAEDCALYTLGKARVSSTCGGTARCEAARVDGFQLAKQDTGQTRCIHKSASAMHSQLLLVVYHASASSARAWDCQPASRSRLESCRPLVTGFLYTRTSWLWNTSTCTNKKTLNRRTITHMWGAVYPPKYDDITDFAALVPGHTWWAGSLPTVTLTRSHGGLHPCP